MPVVSPKASGMTHQVSKTWEVLKHLSNMFERVKALNAQQPSQPRLFPRGSLAIQAAADNTPAKVDINVITAAEARGQHDIWAETSPGSLLLLPTGQSTAAVADLMDVTYNSEAGLISLHVDLVHNLDTISEFQPHGKQSLASDEAHYHFATAPGVKVDAAALLKSLQDDNYQVDGMHLFLKGASGSAPISCAYIYVHQSQPTLGPGQNGTIIVDVKTDAETSCAGATFGNQTELTLLIAGGAEWVHPPAVDVTDHTTTAPHSKVPTGRAINVTAASRSFNLVSFEGSSTHYTTEGLPFVQSTSWEPFTVQVVELQGNGNALDGRVAGVSATVNTGPPRSCVSVVSIVSEPSFDYNVVGADAVVKVIVTLDISNCPLDVFAGTKPFVKLELLSEPSAAEWVFLDETPNMSHAAVPHPEAHLRQPHTGRVRSGAAKNTTRLDGGNTIDVEIHESLTAVALVRGYAPFIIQASLIDALQAEHPAYWGIPSSEVTSTVLSYSVVPKIYFGPGDNYVEGVYFPNVLSCATVSITSDPPASEAVPGQDVTVTITVDGSDGCDIPEGWEDVLEIHVVLQGMNVEHRKVFSRPSQPLPPSLHKPVHQPHKRSDKPSHDAAAKPRTKRNHDCFCDGIGDIPVVFDEANKAKITFHARWESPSACRADPMRQGEFPSVQVSYITSFKYPGIAGGVQGHFGLGNLLIFGSGGGDNPPPSMGSPVASIVLLPAKAYRHIHDPITVIAIALDANKAPIANAPVVLAVYGDCDPWVSQNNYTTNAAGQATFTILSTKSGALSVVAAMVDVNGLPVVSYPAHIIYFDEHSYIDEREEHYFGHSNGGDGNMHEEDDHYGRNAEGYAAAATKAALQKIDALAASLSRIEAAT